MRDLLEKPWTHPTFFNRPHWTRRKFFELAGAGIAGTFLPKRYAKAAEVNAQGVEQPFGIGLKWFHSSLHRSFAR